MKVDYSRDALLGEFSIKTLQDRYMIEGEKSPQDSFARAAAAFADDDEHAQRVYDYVSKLWFMFSTPVLSNGGTDRGLPISCFTGDTYVSTLSGGKQIKDIRVGDKVLTHLGRERKVVATRKSISTDVYALKVNGRATSTRVTGNHLLLTEKGWRPVSTLVPGAFRVKDSTPVAVLNSIEVESAPFTWRVTNPEYKEGTGQFRRNKVTNIEITEEVAWALGFWFSEGSVSDVGTVKTTHKTTPPLEKWLDIIERATGLTGKVRPNKTWFDAEINSKTLAEHFNIEFGKGALIKKLPEWIIKLPLQHLSAFYEGMYEGDGFKTTQDKQIQFSNRELILGLSNILHRLGLHHSLTLDKKTASGVLAGLIRERRAVSPGSRGFPGQPQLRLNTISSLEKISGEYEVFDIEVEEDHSFVASGIIAHNCFLNYVPDSREGITDHYTENAFLSSVGGGIGGSWSALRSVGQKTSKGSESTGVIPFLKVVDAEVLAFSQGVTRRGSYAAYLHVSHPEIEEFIDVRKPTGGDINRKSINLHNAVVISDAFMDKITKATTQPGYDDSWDLIDPHSGEVVKTVAAKALWVKIIQNRVETGEPYIMFEDTVNNAMPSYQKEKGLKVHHSNLCSEIVLPTSPDRTAVCCLSSVNLEKFDEWKDNPNFIPDLIRLLDNVLQHFIDKAPPALWRAVNAAKSERSLGLGGMGFHAYLQSKGVPFESAIAQSINRQMFSRIKSEAYKETLRLAKEKGPCPDSEGSAEPVRNAHLLAIAPNASSSIICGNTSPSIEPFRANAFTQKTKTGSFTLKNPYLAQTLEKYDRNDEPTWRSIVTKKGSVQHLDFLTQDERDTFKTAVEIDQRWVVQHAADRQQFVCQAQSLNLFFPANVSKQELHNVHLMAWTSKVKTLYYLRSEVINRADVISDKALRSFVFDFDNTCLGCEG